MKRLTGLLIFLLLVSGCAWNASITKGKLSQLVPNMTIEQVRNLLGNPLSTETFPGEDNKTLLVWNYRTQYYTDMVGVLHEETTPLVFKDDLLLGWGSNFYDKLISPTLQKGDVRIKIRQE